MSRFADPLSRELPGPGDRVLVAGLGLSGVAAARALRSLGAAVTVADDRDDAATRAAVASLGDPAAVLGALDPDLAASADLLVVSPGIRPDAPLTAAAFHNGVPVWSEIELGYRAARVPIAAITGTNGKTTTTQMTVAALRASGIAAVAAGNIGLPLTEAVAGAAAGGAAVIVCEVSSFQLHFIVSFRATAAVLLNLADDHLDWHGSFDAYAADKGRLFKTQTPQDAAIVWDDPVCLAAAATNGRVITFNVGDPPPGGAGVHDGWIVVPDAAGEPKKIIAVDALASRGNAAVADAIAAAAAACALGAPPARVGDGLAASPPGRHRMEVVGRYGGVTYINDSKATNPHATLAALQGLDGVVLIAGGRNKGVDLSPIGSAIGSGAGIAGVVAIGESADAVEAAFAGRDVPVARADSMDKAVVAAAAMAPPGGIVLLSPACASFDWFADYKARGEAFRRAVTSMFPATGDAAGVGETRDSAQRGGDR